MRIYHLRQVKKEIRVLGFAAKPTGVNDKLYVVGVVFRGKLWLDGVMRTVACGPDITKEVVEMIINSPHHPQIRVILLHGDLLPQNILWDWERNHLGVVDWEFAKIGDAAYDLAIVTRGRRKLFGSPNGLQQLVTAYRRAGGMPIEPADVISRP